MFSALAPTFCFIFMARGRQHGMPSPRQQSFWLTMSRAALFSGLACAPFFLRRTPDRQAARLLRQALQALFLPRDIFLEFKPRGEISHLI